MSWISVILLFGLVLPSNYAWFNKTYGTLEFISPGEEKESLSGARLWCKQRGSTLAEITNEYIWDQFLKIVHDFGLDDKDVILNANGKNLSAWQWINGETFIDADSYQLKIDGEVYGYLNKIEDQKLAITKSLPNCGRDCNHSYVCEHPGDGSCNGTQSSDSIPLDGNCYVFHHDKSINWFEAFHECQKDNGRLATFKNIKMEKASIAQQLKDGRKYWIGLYRYEWRWADSKKLLGISNWITNQPYFTDPCIFVSFPQKTWYCNKCENPYNFVCLRDMTKCVTNPCRNNATCSYVDNNYTCQCALGLTGSYCETKHANECGDDSCQKGATCFDSDTGYICSCAPGSEGLECQTGSSHTLEPPVPDMTMTLIIAVVVIAIVILIILSVLIILRVKRDNKTRKSNDVEVSRRYETRNTPEPAIYSEINSSDKNGNIDKTGSHPSGNAIYGQVVQSSNDDHREDATISSSMVYAELDFVQQDKKAQIPSDPGCTTQPSSTSVGPMGDIYAMVGK